MRERPSQTIPLEIVLPYCTHEETYIGFEQFIVISHDDTFEQGLDSLIRLRKTDGETHLVDENGVARESRDDTSTTIWGQQDVYATSL